MSIRDKKPAERDSKEPADLSSLNVYYSDAGVDTNVTVKELPVIDLTDFTTQMANLFSQYDDDILTDEEYNSKVASLAKIDVSDSIRLYVTGADFDMNSKGEPLYMHLEGYLLVK